MMCYEITAIRKGTMPDLKIVELAVVNDKWEEGDGPHIKGNIQIESTHEGLEDMFGTGFDVCDRFELSSMQFVAMFNDNDST